MRGVRRVEAVVTVVALGIMSALVVAVPAALAYATSIDPITLGRAAPFAILAGDSAINTATTIVHGDVGVFAPAGAETGFTPGDVHGTLYASGAPAVVNAHTDLVAAYAEAAGRPTDFDLAAGLATLTLSPGVHTSVGAVANAGTVTLNGGGDPDAVFVFRVNGALTMAAGATVELTNGTQAKNVFWQVVGAGNIGADAVFVGTLMTSGAIGVGARTLFNGRALAKAAVTTYSNKFYAAPPAVTIDGGAAMPVADDTPTISGTAGLDVPASVEVTVGAQTLSAPVQSNGTWAVTASIMANGPHSVRAAVTDLVGNVGFAVQTLTIDTILPVVTITGGATRLTGETTPTLDGTSDVVAQSVVTVTVGGQILTALVQPSHQWNVTPSSLADGPATVTASVVDEAGNTGIASQVLTVDHTAPAVMLVGGATMLTNEATPTISGTTSAPTDLGGSVTVTVADQFLTTTVQVGLQWSVIAAPILDGIHVASVSITDAAGNTGTTSQVITVDTVPPTVTIVGGSDASTNDPTPTIMGTSDAAPDSRVTVLFDGQAHTTLLQGDATWNLTLATVVDNTYSFEASVQDLAGNTGIARQTLTVDTTGALLTSPPLRKAPPADPSSPAPPEMTPVGPKRVFDTRPGQSANALRVVAKQRIGGAYELQVKVTDLADLVPVEGVSAVSLNVTATNSDAAGFITVYPCGARQSVSSLNFAAGATVANAVIAPVSASGTICIFSNVRVDVVADINGWFATDSGFTPAGPVRVFDTRGGQTAATLREVAHTQVALGGMVEVQMTDLAGYVPATGVDSVSLNVTVSSAAATAGYVTVSSCGPREFVSSVNFVGGQTIANAVIAPVSADGTVCFFSTAATDVIVDINGWFSTGSGFTGVGPKRVLDTRPGQSPNALRGVAKHKVGGASILAVMVTDLVDLVPATGASAVSLNVTATNPDADGFLTVYACGTREEVSSVNYAAGHTASNAVLAPVSAEGWICVFSSSPADVVIDINGWFAGTPS